MAVEMEPAGRFGNALAEALAKKDMSLRELAVKTEGTYEHLRKLYKNFAYPSKYLLKSICDALGLKVSEMDKLIAQDKTERKFGKNASVMLGRDPSVAPFESVIPHLTEDQREMFLTQMQAIARGNRRASGR